MLSLVADGPRNIEIAARIGVTEVFHDDGHTSRTTFTRRGRRLCHEVLNLPCTDQGSTRGHAHTIGEHPWSGRSIRLCSGTLAQFSWLVEEPRIPRKRIPQRAEWCAGT